MVTEFNTSLLVSYSQSVTSSYTVFANSNAAKRLVMPSGQLKQAVPVMGLEPKKVAAEYDRDIIPHLATSLTANEICRQVATKNKLVFDPSGDNHVKVTERHGDLVVLKNSVRQRACKHSTQLQQEHNKTTYTYADTERVPQR